jgi:hypothetical protein
MVMMMMMPSMLHSCDDDTGRLWQQLDVVLVHLFFLLVFLFTNEQVITDSHTLTHITSKHDNKGAASCNDNKVATSHARRRRAIDGV